MWIYFNVREAREHLLTHGFVCTIRDEGKREGRVSVKHGRRVIAEGVLRRVGSVREIDDACVRDSGFATKEEWLDVVRGFGKDPAAMAVYSVELVKT